MLPDRAKALRALIAYKLPIESVLADLRSFGWDATERFAVLTRENVVRILERYLAGELTTAQVTEWAGLLECREDVGFPDGEEDLLSDTIFRLAHPFLNDEVTPELAETIKRELADTKQIG